MSAVALHVPMLMLRPRRRGVGDYYSDNCVGSAWSALNPFCYLYLNRDVSKVASNAIDSGFPTPPAPVPIAQTTLVPTGGFDVAGNPTYDVVPQTPAENQAANVAQLQSFFSNVAGPGSGLSPWVVVGVGAVVAFLFWPRGRGRR